ncbi:MAG: DODA-type extradiol aromatic ring-opening family dioxygenase [Planctomycetia bacterium]
MQAASTMPVVFVSHGAPTMALDPLAARDFGALGRDLPRPRAILVLSAQWLDAPPTIGTTSTREVRYDFSGFPDELRHVRYPAPGAADVAARVQALVPDCAHSEARPWDHGVWTPLVHMHPAADVPVLQLSVPWRWSPARLHQLGARLAPLRREGVLLLASGGMVHNLRRLEWSHAGPPPAWALDFEAWTREQLLAHQHDALLAYRERAPALHLAHPSDDHFVPLLVAAGAASTTSGPVAFPIEGWEHGSLSRTAVLFA